MSLIGFTSQMLIHINDSIYYYLLLYVMVTGEKERTHHDVICSLLLFYCNHQS